MKYAIKIFFAILNFIYLFIKLFKEKNKVTFISRQSDNTSLDFKLVTDYLKKNYKEYEIVILNKYLSQKIDKTIIKYIPHMFKQMYHMATSKVVVIDTYCICVSMLKHKKDLKIIQMWHGMGALKKIGYDVMDKNEGSSKETIELMKMHKNYSYVFASSNFCIKNTCSSFNYPEKNVIVQPLPKVDLLRDKKYQTQKKKEITKKYPNLKNKLNILYAPTFRKESHEEKYINELIKNTNFEKYNLIIKLHPHSKTKIEDKRVLTINPLSTFDLFSVSDYIITDYSATVFEACLLNKPLYFYAYDIDTYKEKRTFYIDYKKEMPGIVSKKAKTIMDAIKNNDYDLEKIKKYANKYVDNNKENVKSICILIDKIIKNEIDN